MSASWMCSSLDKGKKHFWMSVSR